MTDLNYSALKKCAKCKEQKSIGEFHKNKSKSDGLATECRGCANRYNLARYEADKEASKAKMRSNYQKKSGEYKARAKKWQTENVERRRELAAVYREKYREKIKEFSKTDWLKHNEKRRQKKKEYRAANPERGAEHVRARQTRKQNAMPDWADRNAIREIYAECRRISKETGVKHHVDHYYPLKNSLVCGLHCEYNLQIIPAAENQSKGNQIPV